MGVQGWSQDFKLVGAHLQKMGGAKIFGVFLVKNHDFTGTYKVRNEIETKRNQRIRNETKSTKTKRNETKSTK